MGARASATVKRLKLQRALAEARVNAAIARHATPLQRLKLIRQINQIKRKLKSPA